MLTTEEIRKLLGDRRLDIVAKATGLSPLTIARMRDGKGDPKASTVEALSRYFEPELFEMIGGKR
jgi:predicted transcriptional regulator